MLALGTSVLCWSAPWARIICIALWRSRTVRKYSGLIIGQDLMAEIHQPNTVVTEPHAATTVAPNADGMKARHKPAASTGSIRDVLDGGVRITQTLYQSQRRWFGIGWTSNLFPNERSPWSHSPLSSISPSYHANFSVVGRMKLSIPLYPSTNSHYPLTNPSLTPTPRAKKVSVSQNGNGSTRNGNPSSNPMKQTLKVGYTPTTPGKIPAQQKLLENTLYLPPSPAHLNGQI